MTKNEALRMAIDCLKSYEMHNALGYHDYLTYEACKEALKQPAWQGLTNNEIEDIIFYDWGKTKDLVLAIEAKLKEKNHD